MSAIRVFDSHLSSAQLSEWALGEREHKAVRHVASCSTCRAKIEQFEYAVNGFRRSVRGWSEEQQHYPSRITPLSAPVRRNQPFQWRSAGAWTALYVMAALAVVVLLQQQPSWKALPGSDATASDLALVGSGSGVKQLSAQEEAALFTQIDQEISRTVPAAMDPLSALVAGDGARAAGMSKSNPRVRALIR